MCERSTLVGHGAKVNSKIKNGWTLLLSEQMFEETVLVRFLKKVGARQ